MEEHRKVIEAAEQTRAHVRVAIEEAQRVFGLPEASKPEENTATDPAPKDDTPQT